MLFCVAVFCLLQKKKQSRSRTELFKLLCFFVYSYKRVYLCSVLDKLHSAIFQVDETDSHPPQQLQMFGVVCHEVLSSEWRPSHPRLPGWKKVKTFTIQDTDR